MSYKNGLSNKEISEALRLLSDTDLVKNYLVKKSISLAADRIDFNDSLIAELEQQLAKNGEVNRWIPVTERLPDPYKKDLDGLRTVSDIVICKDHLNTFWTDQTYLGYDGRPFWASLKCSCVGWKPIDKSDADSRN